MDKYIMVYIQQKDNIKKANYSNYEAKKMIFLKILSAIIQTQECT